MPIAPRIPANARKFMSSTAVKPREKGARGRGKFVGLQGAESVTGATIARTHPEMRLRLDALPTGPTDVAREPVRSHLLQAVEWRRCPAIGPRDREDPSTQTGP